MVGRASRTALLLPLLLAVFLLPGCRFFTASFFPGYLAQIEKSYDLESEIDGFLAGAGSVDYALRPTVFVLTSSPGTDYGGLLLEIDGTSEKLLFMAGPSGGAQQLTSEYLSQLHFTNSSGDFVVGRHFFPPGDLGSPGDSGLASIDGRAFSIVPSVNYRLWSDGVNLFYQILNIGSVPWSSGTATELPIASGLSGFELQGVYYDPLEAANPLALVFFNGSMNQVYVFRVPAPPSISSPLTAYYPPVSFEDTNPSRVVYTHKGIVVARDREAVLMDFSGQETGKRLSLGEGGDKSFSMDIEGDVFYVFDPENKTLHRGKTGW